MRWLIILVSTMGALIIAGLGLLGYGIYQKATNPDTTLAEADAEPINKAAWARRRKTPPAPFGDKDITLPPGCQVLQIIPGGRRLFLQIGRGGEPGDETCESIIVVDAGDGTVLGTLNIKPAQKPGP